MVWGYRLLLTLAGGLLGLALAPIAYPFFIEVGIQDDLASWIVPCIGLGIGLLGSQFAYSQTWFHWASVILGPPAIAVAIWKSIGFVEQSDRLAKTGSMAGLEELVTALWCLLVAAGFTLLVFAGGMRLFTERRQRIAG